MANDFKPIALTRRRNRHPYPNLNKDFYFLTDEEENPMGKIKVAADWLAACAGCEMSLLDMDERLVQLLDKIELTSTPITDLKHPPKEGVTRRHSLRHGQQHNERRSGQGDAGTVQGPDCLGGLRGFWRYHDHAEFF